MVGVGFTAREETRDSQSSGVTELFASRSGRACPLTVSLKQPI
jgi:hypothetical protein